MLKFLKNIIADPDSEIAVKNATDHRLAICALLLEMCWADDDFTQAEWDHLVETLGMRFELSPSEAEELVELAGRELEVSLDLHRFTRTINEVLDSAGKRELLLEIWRVVYADGKLEAHEDYLVHKFASLLNLRHSDLIEAKLKVIDEIRNS